MYDIDLVNFVVTLLMAVAVAIITVLSFRVIVKKRVRRRPVRPLR